MTPLNTCCTQTNGLHVQSMKVVRLLMVDL